MTGTVTYLSPAWFGCLREATAALPTQPGVTGRIAHVVTGTPDGDVAYVVAFVDGRLTDAHLGAAPEATVATTRTYADGVRIARCELHEEAAFMQGRLKLTGDMGTYLGVQAVTQSPAWRAALAVVAEATAIA